MDGLTSAAVERAYSLDSERHRVWLCREDRGPLGSFKWRGADVHCARLRHEGFAGVVAASTGNFATAVAWAAARHGLVAHVVVPCGAASVKRQRLAQFEATLHEHGETLAEAVAHAQQLAESMSLPYFDDGGSSWQLEGLSSLGVALAGHSLEVVVVPVACGALAAGVALGLRAKGSATSVVGVQVDACSRMAARFHGRPEQPSRLQETIADGLADDRLTDPAYSTCMDMLNDIVVVDEDDLRTAMLDLERVIGSMPEAAGAAALAGLQRFAECIPAGDVAVIVSGGNVDPAVVAAVHEWAAA